MKILAIETSCDETAAAVVEGRRVLSNVIYSQILLHKKWGGVVPSLAKRAHEEKIESVITEATKKYTLEQIDAFAVTQGPGLAIALEVGIKHARYLAKKYGKKLISVNHLEGHLYSPFVQNSRGNPATDYEFPYLGIIISGGHTEFVKFKGHLQYEVIGSTIDDAAGEALDKAAKLLGLGYPGGPVMETLARQSGNKDFHKFPRPMLQSHDLNLSFSGLKTSFYYYLKAHDPESAEDIRRLASSFQEAVFDTIIKKTAKAMSQTGINKIIIGGGVSSNQYLRKKMRDLVAGSGGKALFPSFKYLSGDNAAMIGIVASYKAQANQFVKDVDALDRIPRMSL